MRILLAVYGLFGGVLAVINIQLAVCELLPVLEAQAGGPLPALPSLEGHRAEEEVQEPPSLPTVEGYTLGAFVEALLTPLDNLDRALATEVADPVGQAVLEGVRRTQQQVFGLLAAAGVEPFEAEGERFDPHLHHAVSMVQDPARTPGTVAQVLQRGYRQGGKLLRPAMVTVVADRSEGEPCAT